MQNYCGGVTVEGQPSSLANQRNNMFPCSVVSPGYFRTMGIALLGGRDFDQHDLETAPGVVIVSEAMARGFWPNQDPVGKRIKQGPPNSPWLSIAGVVADVRQEGLAAEPRPAFYTPFLQNPPLPSMTVVVRTGSDPMSVAVAARQQVWILDKELPVQNIRTMTQIVSESLTEPRFHLVLLGTFAGLALLLATVGIYGVMSYFVTQRRHEIGIRVALGADRRQVLSLVVRRGVVTTLVGVAVGLAGARGLMRVMSSLLYAVQPTDPVTLVSVSILLTCVGVLASITLLSSS